MSTSVNPTRSYSQPKKGVKKLDHKSILEDFARQQKEEIKEVFDLFDVEQRGYIQGQNFKICLKTLGVDMKSKEIGPLLYDKFSKKIEASFKFDEFYQFAKEMLDKKDPEEEMSKAFDLLCITTDKKDNSTEKEGEEDDDCYITQESLGLLAKEVGETLTKDEIEDMLTIVGSNNQISRNDFIEFMMSFNKKAKNVNE